MNYWFLMNIMYHNHLVKSYLKASVYVQFVNKYASELNVNKITQLYQIYKYNLSSENYHPHFDESCHSLWN